MNTKYNHIEPLKGVYQLHLKEFIHKFGRSAKLLGRRTEMYGDVMLFFEDPFTEYRDLSFIVDEQPTRFQLAVLDE